MKRKRHLWNVVRVENKQWETVDTKSWTSRSLNANSEIKKIEAFKNEPNQSLAIQKTFKRIVVIVANECKYNIYLYNINLFIYKYL